MSIGKVAILLNMHFPYVRRAGRWPHGEESLFEATAESYVPLLHMLHDLRTSGVQAPLTFAVSPVLLDQLADPELIERFLDWFGAWRARAAEDLARFETERHEHGIYLARFYSDWIASVARTFNDRFGRNLPKAIRSLLGGATELLLTPATYAYLPYLHPTAVRVQLETGALDTLRYLGQRPVGLWLPGGSPPHNREWPAGELQLRYMVGLSHEHTSKDVSGWSLPLVHPDQSLAEHVVSPSFGYPGDGLYREFHRRHHASGFAYWRVTGDDTPLEQKDWYDPYLAFSRTHDHATHFVRVLGERLRAQAGQQAEPAVVLAFDAELFGHWWFEGVHWLQSVLMHLHATADIQLVPLRDVYQQLPGTGGDGLPTGPHPIFDAPAIAALRGQIERATQRFMEVVRVRPAAEQLEEALLSQAARELLLAQSSDWLALVVTAAASDYAHQRLATHLERFERLLSYVEQHSLSSDAEAYLAQVAELDNPFPFINYRMFKSYAGKS